MTLNERERLISASSPPRALADDAIVVDVDAIGVNTRRDDDVRSRFAPSPSPSRSRVAAGAAAIALLGAASAAIAIAGRSGDASDAAATRARLGYTDAEKARALDVRRSIGDKRSGHGFPIFLHIPKTGGTTIETSLGVSGIAEGYCIKREDRAYELHPRYRGWENWHSIPKDYVRKSWAIVRNPYERAESEFLYWTGTYDRKLFDSLKVGYDEGNCEKFAAHLTLNVHDSKIRACYEAGGWELRAQKKCEDEMNEGVASLSHWAPQMLMASRAENLFRIEECFGAEEGECPLTPWSKRHGGASVKEENIISFIHHRYHKKIEMVVTNAWHKDVPKPDLHSCWSRFDPELLNLFNTFYGGDFEHLGYDIMRSAANLGAPSQTVPKELIGLTLGQLAERLPKGEHVAVNNAPTCPPKESVLEEWSHAQVGKATTQTTTRRASRRNTKPKH